MPVLKPFTTDWDLNPCAGTQTQPKSSLALEPTWLGLEPKPKPCLGREPMWLALKPSQNPQHLVSGPQVLEVSSQKVLKPQYLKPQVLKPQYLVSGSSGS